MEGFPGIGIHRKLCDGDKAPFQTNKFVIHWKQDELQLLNRPIHHLQLLYLLFSQVEDTSNKKIPGNSRDFFI